MDFHTEVDHIVEVVEKYSVVIAGALKGPFGALIVMALKHVLQIPFGSSKKVAKVIEDTNDIAEKLKPVEDVVVDLTQQLEDGTLKK
jgi:hypothetical protein